MKPPVYIPVLQTPLFWALFFCLSLVVAIPASSFAQEPTLPSESVADAARKARERKPNSDSTKPTKVLTNDDLVVASAPAEATQVAVGGAARSERESAPTGPSEEAKPQKSICPNANEEQINSELQTAQEELDQLRQELSTNGSVISNGDVDLSNFKPGSSGVTFGSPPLLESTPQAPGRIREVQLEEKVAALKKAARVACDSRQEAKIQVQLDSAESQLKLLQQQFNLDQSVYYSRTDYAGDAAGKARLDAEQQQIQALQEEVDSLREQLPAEEARPAPE
jgi:hypothetical protein